jgi:methionyl aminopeptidase
LKSSQEIEKMRRAGQVVREVLELVRSRGQAGRHDPRSREAAEARLKELGVKAAFKGYHGFPCVLCTSVNSEVVHGIPSPKRVLKKGTLFRSTLARWWTATTATRPSPCRWARSMRDAARLLAVTEASLHAGIAAVGRGRLWAMWARRCRMWSKAEGFSVVRDFVGHGIGVHMHEDPQVPNFGERGRA